MFYEALTEGEGAFKVMEKLWDCGTREDTESDPTKCRFASL